MTGSSFIICLLFIAPVLAQYEGDRCQIRATGENGKCTVFGHCEYAKNLLMLRQRPQTCSFWGFIPIVCCPLVRSIQPGQRSAEKCNSYYPRPIFKFRRLVFGGTQSLAKEFPHMAILGYGNKDNIQWLCGGSLISEQFVLTAAHCITSQDLGVVQWVRLGDLDISNTTDDAEPQDFAVDATHVHPEYRSSSHYNDIGLIRLDREAGFNAYVKPGCLYFNRTLPDELLIATGWGKVEFLGERSSHLMKVDLNFISHDQCAKSYKNVQDRKLKNGIIEKMQICAGRPDGGDTCPGDSGGPLQFKESNPVHHYIVGITSFGKACGEENSVGVYTRVAEYIGWIEDIVWPN